MAVATITAGGNMVTRFARRAAAVVAAGTGAGDRRVIDIGIGPVAGDMTVIASVKAGDMRG